MGNSHSAGRDNDELIDILAQENYIETKQVENAFRKVDRGDYIPDFPPSQVYADQTLRRLFLHLSAPCIYAKVVQSLDLRLGNSFLNIGSGTGYLSTIVGTLIGPNAINHGIEVREDTVRHAYTCLEKYITACVTFDAGSFGVPYFVCGNGLDIDPGYRKYDRIYVGAEVPPPHKDLFCRLLADGGKLIMPYMGQLVCITREEDKYTCLELLSVSFSPLLTHELIAEESGSDDVLEERSIIQLEVRLRSLQELCRLVIYCTIGRENLSKVKLLPVSPMLHDYICYYRDPDLPHYKERNVYTTPPASARPDLLQDPLGLREYIRIMNAVDHSSESEDENEDENEEEEMVLDSDDDESAEEEEEEMGSDNDIDNAVSEEGENRAEALDNEIMSLENENEILENEIEALIDVNRMLHNQNMVLNSDNVEDTPVNLNENDSNANEARPG